MKAIFSLFFALATIHNFFIPVESSFITPNFQYGKPSESRRIRKSSQKIISICGGSTAADSSYMGRSIDSDSTNIQLTGNATCLISTSLGSTFLDKVKRISISRNATILDLKASIQEKFPGTPPITLQKLVFGFRALNNTELIGNISTGNQIPILLDMITGTSSYNRTMSITQALEAYVSVVIHQTYLSGLTRKVFDNKDKLESLDTTTTTISLDNPEQIETLSYREMFELINQTVYNQHAAEIAIALEREKEPDVLTADTIAWRKNQGSLSAEDDEEEDGGRNPLVSAFAKQFDTNKQVALALTYYSVVLVVFSKYATSAKGSKSFLLVMVPFLWLSKLRQFRLASKVGLTLFLQVAPYIDFIMPLLPAPYQVIALESKKWKTPPRYVPAAAANAEEDEEGDDEEPEDSDESSSNNDEEEGVDDDDDDETNAQQGEEEGGDDEEQYGQEEDKEDSEEDELQDGSNDEADGGDDDNSNRDDNDGDDEENDVEEESGILDDDSNDNIDVEEDSIDSDNNVGNNDDDDHDDSEVEDQEEEEEEEEEQE